MKTVFIVCALVVAISARPGEHYTDKYDNVDVDEILNNPRLMENYKKCMLDQGKCTSEGKELKTNLPDALTNDCAKCTPKQKEVTKRVMKHLIKKEKEFWQQLRAKYDPDNKYAEKYEKELS